MPKKKIILTPNPGGAFHPPEVGSFRTHYEATGELTDEGLIVARRMLQSKGPCAVRINGEEVSGVTTLVMGDPDFCSLDPEQVSWVDSAGEELVQASRASVRLRREQDPVGPATATGQALDRLATDLAGLMRRPGETDASFRSRINGALTQRQGRASFPPMGVPAKPTEADERNAIADRLRRRMGLP